MNILFYTPLNSQCRDIQSQAITFQKKGHSIFLLTQGSTGDLHQRFHDYSEFVEADNLSSGNLKWLLFKRWLKLIAYCWKWNIDVVYAHLEPANFVAVLAQYFIRAKVVICRHHVDEAALYAFGNDLSYKITYKLAKRVIVVSERAKKYMVQHEGVPANKIHVIRLSYDFSLYPQPDRSNAEQIRKTYSAEVLLLSVCRLTKFKRPELSVEVVETLVQKGIDAKLIILGQGEMMSDLKAMVASKGLENKVFLIGYVSNVTDFMCAANILVHPSLLDSSSISFKEAGLVSLPVIACTGVGDFDEVIQNGYNGFLVDPDLFVPSAVDIIAGFKHNKAKLKEVGSANRHFVTQHFDVKNVASYYEEVFHGKK